MTNRPISTIAREIRANWLKPYFGAIPYLQAMQTLTSINDNYGYDSADSIIRYFLGNAQTWRGDKAKEIKKELNNMLKS